MFPLAWVHPVGQQVCSNWCPLWNDFPRSIIPNDILLLIKGSNSNGVLITKLDVPHSIENGTKEYTDLDCEYTLRDNMTDLLVVTWLYNDHTIIYKWIPSHDVRATHSMLRNRVDMDFTVSTVPWEMYRALRILKPTTELSGKYTCDVSTKDVRTFTIFAVTCNWAFFISRGIAQHSQNWLFMVKLEYCIFESDLIKLDSWRLNFSEAKGVWSGTNP